MYCFSKCCRLCLTKNNTLVTITNSGSDGISFLDKLGLLAPSLVTNPRNNYMSWICEQCRQKLNKAYSFIQNCFKSDTVLDEFYEQLTNADPVQYKCTNSDVSDIQLTENMIEESIPITIKQEYLEDLPANVDDQYYFESTITIEKHEPCPINFEYIKVESSELKQETDLNVGDDPISNHEIIVSEYDRDQPEKVQQIDPIAGTSVENNISLGYGPLSHAVNADSCNLNSSNLLTKNQSIKTEEPLNKRFKCGICNKSFTQSGHLKLHKRIHSGERPYECEICNKKFSQHGTLKRHDLVHTGQRPYECKICNKKFTESGSLKTHEKIHTGERPYECKICNITFTYAGSLKQHGRTHSGERPYECQICNKTFTQSGSLKLHKRIHSGERAYECKVCGRKFIRLDTLKRHGVLMHSDDRS